MGVPAYHALGTSLVRTANVLGVLAVAKSPATVLAAAEATPAVELAHMLFPPIRDHAILMKIARLAATFEDAAEVCKAAARFLDAPAKHATLEKPPQHIMAVFAPNGEEDSTDYSRLSMGVSLLAPGGSVSLLWETTAGYEAVRDQLGELPLNAWDFSNAGFNAGSALFIARAKKDADAPAMPMGLTQLLIALFGPATGSVVM